MLGELTTGNNSKINNNVDVNGIYVEIGEVSLADDDDSWLTEDF